MPPTISCSATTRITPFTSTPPSPARRRRRSDYRIELVSTILQNDIKNTAVTYVKDESGKYAYYTDEYKLKKEGKLGRRSKLERVFYDWNTGEEVKRELVSEDYYSGERDTYWVGVHKP